MPKLTRLEKLQNRRIDPLIKASGLNEAHARLMAEDSAVRYAIGAMQPIDPVYTRNTIDERNRVETQLSDGYRTVGLNVQFDYQGSVTNDTHIRAHSDVDLLTIETRWVSADNFGQSGGGAPGDRYEGNPIEDLRQIRREAARILRSGYPSAVLDESGSKSLSISGGSLRRKIDVIASAWWNTVEYLRELKKFWRGIEILDHKNGVRISNRPFLHNKRIEDRDDFALTGLRRVIRLLKSLKYDSDEQIQISSYDIAGIAYNIFDDWIKYRPGFDLLLVKNCQAYLQHLLTDRRYRESIDVPNQTRKVFCPEGATETGLRQLSTAVDILVQEIEQGLSRSFRKLAEARISY